MNFVELLPRFVAQADDRRVVDRGGISFCSSLREPLDLLVLAGDVAVVLGADLDLPADVGRNRRQRRAALRRASPSRCPSGGASRTR